MDRLAPAASTKGGIMRKHRTNVHWEFGDHEILKELAKEQRTDVAGLVVAAVTTHVLLPEIQRREAKSQCRI